MGGSLGIPSFYYFIIILNAVFHILSTSTYISKLNLYIIFDNIVTNHYLNASEYRIGSIFSHISTL